jgi:hypothetical protein
MAKDNLEELIKELSLTAETSHELDNHMNTTTNTQVYQTLKEFDEVEFPKELHGRIMRSVYLRQFKTPLAVINTILFANLSLSVYRLWTLMGDSVQAVAGQVPTQAHSFFASFQAAAASVPLGSAAVVAINCSLFAAGVYLMVKLQSMIAVRRMAGSQSSS